MKNTENYIKIEMARDDWNSIIDYMSGYNVFDIPKEEFEGLFEFKNKVEKEIKALDEANESEIGFVDDFEHEELIEMWAYYEVYDALFQGSEELDEQTMRRRALKAYEDSE